MIVFIGLDTFSGGLWMRIGSADHRFWFYILRRYRASAKRFKDVMESKTYLNVSVPQLKDELRRRGATTRGRKADLIERYNFCVSDIVIFSRPSYLNKIATKCIMQTTHVMAL